MSPQIITSPRVISFHYTVRNTGSEILDSSRGDDPLSFLEGAGQILPSLEKLLLELPLNEKREVVLNPTEAYGERDERLVTKVAKNKLPTKKIKVGDQFQTGPHDQPQILTVTIVEGDEVTLDGNHPLAGQTLHFEVEVTETRQATAEELVHGHAHGPGGHHHH